MTTLLTRILPGIALSIAVLFGISSCTKKWSQAHLRTVTAWHQNEAKTLDPASASDATSWEVISLVYETLYEYSFLSDPYEVTPLLAADMPQISDEGKTIVIPIRKEIYFQDDPAFTDTAGKGRELTANDFIYSFKRLGLPGLKSQGIWIFSQRVLGMEDFFQNLVQTDKKTVQTVFSQKIAGLSAPDRYTLKIELMKPYPQLIHALTLPVTSAVPVEAVESYANENGELLRRAVGTGPFKIKEWDYGDHILLARNPNYHPEFFPNKAASRFQTKSFEEDAAKPVPFVDQIRFEIIPDEQEAWLKLLDGSLEVIHQASPRQVKMGLKNAKPAEALSDLDSPVETTKDLQERNIQVQREASEVFTYLSFNMKDPLVGTNKLLRQALSSAIDRTALIRDLSFNKELKADSPLPPGVPGRDPKAKLKYDYDLEKAKELLKKAGFESGDKLPSLTVRMRGTDQFFRDLGKFISEEWEKIGVKTTVIFHSFPGFLEKIRASDFQIAVGVWSLDYPDAENVYRLLYGPNHAPGPNESSFNDPEYNKLYDELVLAHDQKQRFSIIEKMNAILNEEIPWAMLTYRLLVGFTQPWIEHYRASEIIRNRYKYIKVNEEMKKQAMKSGQT